MDISPQRVRSAEFKSVRKGVDPEQVRQFLNEVADELERAQNQATAMEARARAAVARLQEVGDGASAKQADTAVAVEPSAEEADTISRTLLLAQRTADTTIAEARAEAERLLRNATDEAATTRDSTREMAAQILDEARQKARQAGEAERLSVAGEVDALKARRDFLESDVEHLELFLTDQRTRIREAATSLLELTERVPGGLGTVRPPLLSAADDTGNDDDDDDDEYDDDARTTTFGSFDDDDVDAGDYDDDDDDDGGEGGEGGDSDLVIQTDIADRPEDADGADGADEAAGDDLSWAADEPTQAMPVVESARGTDDSGGFRFSFDDDDR